MNGNQDQSPMPSVNCPSCGRENPAGRPFCKFCGHRIATRPQDEPGLDEKSASLGEAQRLQAALQAAQDENRNLHQQLSSMQEEFNKVKAPNASSSRDVEELNAKLKSEEAKSATLESQSARWEKKWRSAEEKLASFEKQMAAKAKEIKATFRPNSDLKSQPNHLLKFIAGALIVMGSLGGYAAGRHLQMKNDSKGTVKQLSTQETNSHEEINNLKLSLDSANKKVNQVDSDSKLQADSANQKISDLTNKLTAREGQQHTIETRLVSTQRELASTQAQLVAANTQEHSTEAALNQHIQQLEADVRSRDNEISTLRGRVASLSSTTTPHAGSLIWSGTVVGKRRIEIKGGVADYGTVISGALPRTPCTLTASDPSRVQLKTRPAPKNQWNQVSFDVSGMGVVQARIDWVSSQ
jgi:predicted  nucleic acid-binding Zn-ribbon protein